MSIMMPPELEWIAALAGGTWPKADEDKLWALCQAHKDYAKELRSISERFGNVLSDVQAGVSGATAEQFESYLRKFQTNLNDVASACETLADRIDEFAVKIEYAKLMILMTLASLAAEIAFLAWFAPWAIGAWLAAGRSIWLRLLALVGLAAGIGAGVGGLMSAAAQGIQFLMGHRHQFSFGDFIIAVGSGALSGAITGGLFAGVGALGEAGEAIVSSLLGKMVLGGLGGAAGTAASDAAFDLDGSPGLGLVAGMVGGAIGHIPELRGGKGGPEGDGYAKIPEMDETPPDLGGDVPHVSTETPGPETAPPEGAGGSRPFGPDVGLFPVDGPGSGPRAPGEEFGEEFGEGFGGPDSESGSSYGEYEPYEPYEGFVEGSDTDESAPLLGGFQDEGPENGGSSGSEAPPSGGQSHGLFPPAEYKHIPESPHFSFEPSAEQPPDAGSADGGGAGGSSAYFGQPGGGGRGGADLAGPSGGAGEQYGRGLLPEDGDATSVVPSLDNGPVRGGSVVSGIDGEPQAVSEFGDGPRTPSGTPPITSDLSRPAPPAPGGTGLTPEALGRIPGAGDRVGSWLEQNGPETPPPAGNEGPHEQIPENPGPRTAPDGGLPGLEGPQGPQQHSTVSEPPSSEAPPPGGQSGGLFPSAEYKPIPESPQGFFDPSAEQHADAGLRGLDTPPPEPGSTGLRGLDGPPTEQPSTPPPTTVGQAPHGGATPPVRQSAAPARPETPAPETPGPETPAPETPASAPRTALPHTEVEAPEPHEAETPTAPADGTTSPEQLAAVVQPPGGGSTHTGTGSQPAPRTTTTGGTGAPPRASRPPEAGAPETGPQQSGPQEHGSPEPGLQETGPQQSGSGGVDGEETGPRQPELTPGGSHPISDGPPPAGTPIREQDVTSSDSGTAAFAPTGGQAHQGEVAQPHAAEAVTSPHPARTPDGDPTGPTGPGTGTSSPAHENEHPGSGNDPSGDTLTPPETGPSPLERAFQWSDYRADRDARTNEFLYYFQHEEPGHAAAALKDGYRNFVQKDHSRGWYLPKDSIGHRQAEEYFLHAVLDDFKLQWQEKGPDGYDIVAWGRAYEQHMATADRYFANASSRHAELVHMDEEFTNAVEQARENDLFGGWYLQEAEGLPSRDDYETDHYKDPTYDTDNGKPRPGEDGFVPTSLSHLRADTFAKVRSIVDRAHEAFPDDQAARRGAIDAEVSALRENLPQRIGLLADSSREVYHATRLLDETLDPEDFDGGVPPHALDEENVARLRQEIQDDLHMSYQRARQAADPEVAAARAREELEHNWQQTVHEMHNGLDGRLARSARPGIRKEDLAGLRREFEHDLTMSLQWPLGEAEPAGARPRAEFGGEDSGWSSTDTETGSESGWSSTDTETGSESGWSSTDTEEFGGEDVATLRQEFQDNLRMAFEQAREAADPEAAAARAQKEFERNWQQTVDRMFDTLDSRIGHAEFRQFRNADLQERLNEAFGYYEDEYLRSLDDGAKDRLTTELTHVNEKMVDEHWFGHLNQPDTRAHAQPRWDGDDKRPARSYGDNRAQLDASVESRFDHEFNLREVLEGAAEDFRPLRWDENAQLEAPVGERLSPADALFKETADAFRKETVHTFDDLFAPHEHNIGAWLEHEKDHENTFQNTLNSPLPPDPAPAPPRPPESGPSPEPEASPESATSPDPGASPEPATSRGPGPESAPESGPRSEPRSPAEVGLGDGPQSVQTTVQQPAPPRTTPVVNRPADHAAEESLHEPAPQEQTVSARPQEQASAHAEPEPRTTDASADRSLSGARNGQSNAPAVPDTWTSAKEEAIAGASGHGSPAERADGPLSDSDSTAASEQQSPSGEDTEQLTGSPWTEDRVLALSNWPTAPQFPEFPGVPEHEPFSPQHRVTARLDELAQAAGEAGMPPSVRQQLMSQVREAAGANDWIGVAGHLREFRERIDLRLLRQQQAAVNDQIDAGFEGSGLAGLGASREQWQQKADAVIAASDSHDPGVLDAALRAYTAYVERHVPPEVLTGADSSRPYDPQLERVQELFDADPAGQGEQLRQRLLDLLDLTALRDRLQSVSPDVRTPREDILWQLAESAADPEQAFEYVRQMHDERQRNALAEDPGRTEEALQERFDALRAAEVDEGEHEELWAKVWQATSEEEASRAVQEYDAYREERRLSERFGGLADSHEGSGDQTVVPDEADLRRRLDALPEGLDSSFQAAAAELRVALSLARTSDEAAMAVRFSQQRLAELDQARQAEAAALRDRIAQVRSQLLTRFAVGEPEEVEHARVRLAELEDQLDNALSQREKWTVLIQELTQRTGAPVDPERLERIVAAGLRALRPGAGDDSDTGSVDDGHVEDTHGYTDPDIGESPATSANADGGQRRNSGELADLFSSLHTPDNEPGQAVFDGDDSSATDTTVVPSTPRQPSSPAEPGSRTAELQAEAPDTLASADISEVVVNEPTDAFPPPAGQEAAAQPAVRPSDVAYQRHAGLEQGPEPAAVQEPVVAEAAAGVPVSGGQTPGAAGDVVWSDGRDTIEVAPPQGVDVGEGPGWDANLLAAVNEVWERHPRNPEGEPADAARVAELYRLLPGALRGALGQPWTDEQVQAIVNLLAPPGLYGGAPGSASAARPGRAERKVIQNWRALSSAGGWTRSSALREIDGAVEQMPQYPDEQDLRRVLRAVSRWKEGKTPSSRRWDAVTQLERAVNSLLSALVAPREAFGWSNQYPTEGLEAQVAAWSSPFAVEGFAPGGGWEAELHGYRTVLPAGVDLADYGTVVELPGVLHITLDRHGGVPVLEVVSVPARGLSGGSGDGRADRADVVAGFVDVLDRLAAAPRNARLSVIFPEVAGYRVAPEAADLPVRQNEAVVGQMLVHFTEAIPLARVAKFMQYVLDRMRTEAAPLVTTHQDGRAAVAFGARWASFFPGWLAANPAWQGYSRPADMREIEGIVALGYSQVAAVARELAGAQMAKDLTVVASRDMLAGLRADLSPAARAFLEGMRDALRQEFVRTLTEYAGPRFGDVLSWRLRQRTEELQQATIGDYWDNVLLQNPRYRISQYHALLVRTDFPEPDRNVRNGVPLIRPSAVRLEARSLARLRSTPATLVSDFLNLGQVSVGLYNEARELHGLPPVGHPVTHPASEGFGPFAAPPVATDGRTRSEPLPQASSSQMAGVELSPEAAHFIESRLRIPGEVEQPASARTEVSRLLGPMLRDPATVGRLSDSGVQVVVVPRGLRVTDLPEFAGLQALTAHPDSGGDRPVSELRGLTTHPGQGALVAIPEENLVGETAGFGLPGGHYPDGYSAATHELAHMIYTWGLTDGQRALVRSVYDAKRADGRDVQWPDGTRTPTDNYSSRSSVEYFAQAVNGFLGTNHGRDPYTGQERNNGASRLRETEPAELIDLLTTLFGEEPAPLRANPVATPGIGQDALEAYRDFVHPTDPQADGESPQPQVPEPVVTAPGGRKAESVGGPGEPSPAPWYARGEGDVHALGDLEVVQVGRPVDAVAQARAAVEAFERAPVSGPEQGAPAPAFGQTWLSQGLKDDLVREVTLALESTDEREWGGYLRSGITVGDSTTVARVRFELAGAAELPDPEKDPVLSFGVSKYGDTSFGESESRESDSGVGLTAGGMIRMAQGAVSAVVPSVQINPSTSRRTTHGVADEVQAGSRPTNAQRVDVAHGLRIVFSARTGDGRTAVASRPVNGKTVQARHPKAFAQDPEHPKAPVAVRNPAAVEGFDRTLGALDTRALEDAFLRVLLESEAVAPEQAPAVMEAATTEIVDEKSMRDRGEYVFSGSLTSSPIQTPGFTGYVALGLQVLSVQDHGTSDEGGIRNDIAETVTVKNSTGHGQRTGFRGGADMMLLPGVAVHGHLSAAFRSSRATESGVQGQAKTAVIHNGPQRRFVSVVRVSGRLEADPRWTLPTEQRWTGHVPPVTRPFSADLTGEILVPEQQAEAFLAAVTRDPPPAEAARPRPAPLTRQTARAVVDKFWPGRGGRRSASAVLAAYPKAYRGLRAVRAAGLALVPGSRTPAFPTGGFADHDGDGFTAAGLASFVRWVGSLRGPVALHVPHGYAFSPAERAALAGLQADRGVRVFESGDPANGDGPSRLTFTSQATSAPQPPGDGPGGIEMVPPGTAGGVRIDRADAAAEDLLAPDLAYAFVLDRHGVSHGWTGRGGQAVTVNPARTAADPARTPAADPARTVGEPAAPAAASPSVRTVSDVGWLAAPPGAQPRPVAVVTDKEAGQTSMVRGALAGLRRTGGLALTEIHGGPWHLVDHAGLPAEGFVVNPAGRVVWGWQPGPVADWGAAGEPSPEALTGLLRQAGRTGLQLVVDPEGPAAALLKGAVTQVRSADEAQRLAWQRAFARAAENDGAGLPALSGDDLLRMLVTDPGVRIVDEHGTVVPGLNARWVFRTTPGGAGEAPTAVRLRLEGVDLSRRMGEEYTLRSDGTLSRSVAWPRGGTATGHVRRAVFPADPRTETPELAARIGLGSAAVKELPGLERVHAEVRAIVHGMIDARYGLRPRDGAAGVAGDTPEVADNGTGSATSAGRRTKLAALARSRVDKRLQISTSVPKLRGARDRGFDTGLRGRFTAGGRRYDWTVRQVMLDRDGDAPVATETEVAIDHQSKGGRSSAQDVTREWEAGVDGGVTAHVEAGHTEHRIDIGEFGGGVDFAREHHTSMADGTKGYSRLRGGNAEAARPNYAARYQVTVTETRRSLMLSGRRHVTRTVSRVIAGDGVRVPAIVHPAFRPDAATAQRPEFVSAFKDTAATAGRATPLTEAEFAQLVGGDNGALDFGVSGTDGLHATFTGLSEAVKTAAALVKAHAAGEPVTEANPWDEPEYVEEVEKTVTEGFLRSNLPQLLSPRGVPIPLPKEYHWNPLLAHVDSSLTVRAHLVPGDEDGQYGAPQASVESYSEYDTKVTKDGKNTWTGDLLGSAGPVFRFGRPPEAGAAEGGGESSESAARSRHRAIGPRVGMTVQARGALGRGTKTAETAGSIDVSLLTEPGGEQSSARIGRAHLVLEFTSLRQPVDAGPLAKGADLVTGSDRNSASSRRTAHLLLENAAELSMSATLHEDLRHAGEPGYLTPPPREEQTRHVERDDTAFAAGYATYVGDRTVAFRGTTSDGRSVHVPSGAGVLGAIRAGLLESGLVPERYLNDTSDTWRALAATYDTEELKAHPDDLRGVGLTKRYEFPRRPGRTRKVAVTVRAGSGGLRHVRTRDNGVVTMGGQSLTQRETSRSTTRSVSGGAGAEGMYSSDFAQYGSADAGVEYEHESTTEHGNAVVTRDIRRTNPVPRQAGGPETEGEGEEFAADLTDFVIEIHDDTELPEPLRRVPDTRVSGTPREPAVVLRPVAPAEPDDGEQRSGTPVPVPTRIVVPRNLTEPGPPSAFAVAGSPAPAPEVRAVPEETVRPGALEYELGATMQPLTFPGLEHVARWAPAATLDHETTTGYLDRPDSPVAPRPAGFRPTADRGVETVTTLKNRNVRDNSRQLFEHRFAVVTDGPGKPLIGLGVLAGVVRPKGTPAEYSGLTFTERADEPTHSHEVVSSWTADAALGGGDEHGAGIPQLGEPSVRHGGAVEMSTGDYVEYNRTFRSQTLPYGGTFSYVVSGPRGYALRIDQDRHFEGLLPLGWAEQAAERFPSQVVHPAAVALVHESADRDAELAEIRERVGRQRQERTADGKDPWDGQPLRLVADLNGATTAEAFFGAARDLALATRTPVDLAYVHYDGPRPTHLEHLLIDPADPQHAEAVAARDEHLALEAQRAARRAAAAEAVNEYRRTNERVLPDISAARATAAALAEARQADPRSLADLQGEAVRAADAATRVQRVADEAAAGSQDAAADQADAEAGERPPAPTAEQILAARQAAEAAQQASDARKALVDADSAARAKEAAARRAIDESETTLWAARAAVTEIDDAAVRAGQARDASRQHATTQGHAATAAAENRSDLSHATPADAVATAWKTTPSGYALPSDNTAYADALGLEALPAGARALALAAPDDQGTYTVRGKTFTTAELAEQITARLTADGAAPPRRLVVHGPRGTALAQELSRLLAPYTVDVLGAHGDPRPASGVTGLARRTADRFRLTAAPTTGWTAYRGGLPIDTGLLGPRTTLTDVLTELQRPAHWPTTTPARSEPEPEPQAGAEPERPAASEQPVSEQTRTQSAPSGHAHRNTARPAPSVGTPLEPIAEEAAEGAAEEAAESAEAGRQPSDTAVPQHASAPSRPRPRQEDATDAIVPADPAAVYGEPEPAEVREGSAWDPAVLERARSVLRTLGVDPEMAIPERVASSHDGLPSWQQSRNPHHRGEAIAYLIAGLEPPRGRGGAPSSAGSDGHLPAEGAEIGSEVSVPGPRRAIVTTVPAHAIPAASHTEGGGFTWTGRTLSGGIPQRYDVSSEGVIELPSGQVLSAEWLRYGDDFLHVTESYILGGDSGWIGRVADLHETVHASQSTDDLVPYSLVARPNGMYLVPDAGTASAVYIPFAAGPGESVADRAARWVQLAAGDAVGEGPLRDLLYDGAGRLEYFAVEQGYPGGPHDLARYLLGLPSGADITREQCAEVLRWALEENDSVLADELAGAAAWATAQAERESYGASPPAEGFPDDVESDTRSGPFDLEDVARSDAFDLDDLHDRRSDDADGGILFDLDDLVGRNTNVSDRQLPDGTTRDYHVIGADARGLLFPLPPGIRDVDPLDRAVDGAATLYVQAQDEDQEASGLYADARPALAVSADHTLALLDEHGHSGRIQVVYATRKTVEDASEKLAATRAGIDLVTNDGIAIVLHKPDGTESEPLYQVSPVFRSADGHAMNEACRDFAQEVAGGNTAPLSHLVFRDPQGRSAATAEVNGLDGWEVTGTHFVAQTLADVAHNTLPVNLFGPRTAAMSAAEDRMRIGGNAGAVTPGERYGQAQSHPQGHPLRDGLDAAAQAVGVNEHAWPGVGEGYLIQGISTVDASGNQDFQRNFAIPDDPSSGYFGYHFAQVVLSSEDGNHHVTLENFSRNRANYGAMFETLHENLWRTTVDGLVKLTNALEREIDLARQEEAGKGKAAVKEKYLKTARALLAVQRASQHVASVPRESPEYPDAFQQLEEAQNAAVLTMLKAVPLPPGRDLWHFRLHGKALGETFHEHHGMGNSHSGRVVVNPLTAVVLHGHTALSLHTAFRFDQGSHQVENQDWRANRLALALARIALWNRAEGIPLPRVTVTGRRSSGRYLSVATRSSRRAQQRAESVAELIWKRLAGFLEEMQKGATGRPLTVADFPTPVTRTEQSPRGTERETARQVVVTVDDRRTVGPSRGTGLGPDDIALLRPEVARALERLNWQNLPVSHETVVARAAELPASTRQSSFRTRGEAIAQAMIRNARSPRVAGRRLRGGEAAVAPQWPVSVQMQLPWSVPGKGKGKSAVAWFEPEAAWEPDAGTDRVWWRHHEPQPLAGAELDDAGAGILLAELNTELARNSLPPNLLTAGELQEGYPYLRARQGLKNATLNLLAQQIVLDLIQDDGAEVWVRPVTAGETRPAGRRVGGGAPPIQGRLASPRAGQPGPSSLPSAWGEVGTPSPAGPGSGPAPAGSP